MQQFGKMMMGIRMGFREWRGRAWLWLGLLCYGASISVVCAASSEAVRPLAMPSKDLEYRWNLASDGKNVFVAVNYAGAMSALAKNCVTSAPPYPYQAGAVLRAQDGWLMASVRAPNPANSAQATHSRNSFDQVYVWQNMGGSDGQPSWQLSARLSAPVTLPQSMVGQAAGVGQQGGVKYFTDDIAIEVGDSNTLLVGARLNTDPPKPPVVLLYRKSKKDWLLDGILPPEPVGLGDADGLCLATAEDQVALGYKTGGLAVYNRVGVGNARWERRGHVPVGCDHAAFVGDQFFVLNSGRLHQLSLVDKIWQPSGAPLVYREQASLFPYSEQFTVQDSLLAVSDSGEQQVHIYLRNAQPMQQWRRQTSLGEAKNPAQDDGIKSFGRRLAMAQNHLFVVQRGELGNDAGINSKTSAVESLAHFARNPLDGSWSKPQLISIADLANTQRLLTLTLNPKTCAPEIDSRSDQSSPPTGDRSADSPPFLGAIYVLR